MVDFASVFRLADVKYFIDCCVINNKKKKDRING